MSYRQVPSGRGPSGGRLPIKAALEPPRREAVPSVALPAAIPSGRCRGQPPAFLVSLQLVCVRHGSGTGSCGWEGAVDGAPRRSRLHARGGGEAARRSYSLHVRVLGAGTTLQKAFGGSPFSHSGAASVTSG